MPFHILLACVAVVAAVPLGLWSFRGLRPPAAPVRRGLEPLADLRHLDLGRSAVERLIGPALRRIASSAQRLTPVGLRKQLERRIAMAGLQGRWPVERLVAVKVLLAAAGAILGLGRLASGGGALFPVVIAAVGFFAPDGLLILRGRERQRTIQRTLPDVLDQITVSVEAGLGFDAALAQAGRTGRGPIADELTRTIQDIRMGTSRLGALTNLIERTDVADLRHFVMALKQSEQYGVPIAQVLRVHSKELREKRRQRAEEEALKLPVKIVFPLLFCVMPALFVVILGPPGLRIADSLIGP